ncbi:uncharacterized protein [Macrobrachium rosenbergii]|uniref:uncharacterized protein n=1 Tax=Macrobrachium rosenbergii TaxID=79674 RepID=UPI0034D68BD7
MSEEECGDYDVVKELVLSAYRLVPEAYHKKFRSLRRDESNAYVEYGKKLERLFYDWLTSAEVDNSDDLKNLVLLENFKDNVSPEIKLYIEDRREKSFADVTRWADEYSLTHRLGESKKESDPSSDRVQLSKYSSNSGSDTGKSDCCCYAYGKPGRTSRFCKNKRTSSNSEVTCYRSNKKGHLSRNSAEGKNVKKPVSLVSSLSSSINDVMKETRKFYGEFLSEGVVSSLEGGDSREVSLLWDTGADASLIRRDSVPTRTVIITKEQVMLGGFPNTCVVCPLLEVNLESRGVSWEVKLAVVDSLPVDGIGVIVGNDLATSKCVNPILSELPVPELVVTRSGLDTAVDYSHDLFVDSNENVFLDSNECGRGGITDLSMSVKLS